MNILEGFWRENPQNADKINALFADFSRPGQSEKLENYSFEYRGVKFVGLDFASRDKDTQLFSMLNATDIEATVDYLQQQLVDCGEKENCIADTLSVKRLFWRFPAEKFSNIGNVLLNSSCNIINLAGHKHEILKLLVKTCIRL